MHSDPLVIPVIINNDPNPQFIRANVELLKKNSMLFDQMQSSQEKEDLLNDLWKTTYNACLIKDYKQYTGIKFYNTGALSMFLLQWS
jgi:hypothetical protein